MTKVIFSTQSNKNNQKLSHRLGSRKAVTFPSLRHHQTGVQLGRSDPVWT